LVLVPTVQSQNHSVFEVVEVSVFENFPDKLALSIVCSMYTKLIEDDDLINVDMHVTLTTHNMFHA